MTRQQALSLSNALAARKMPHHITYAVDAASADVYGIQLDASHSYAGADLSALAAYCDANALALTAVFNSLGVT